jgi:hypothetical protein
MDVFVQGTGERLGTLGKGTGIIGVIDTAIAERLTIDRLMQGHSRMTVGLEKITTVGTL